MTAKLLTALCATAFLTLLATSVQAAKPDDLLVGKSKSIAPGQYGKQAIESNVDVSGAVNGRKIINLKLPDGTKVRLERTGFEAREDGGTLWTGVMADNPDSEVTLTIVKGKLVGRLRIGTEIYEILPGKGGKTMVQSVDLNALPECDTDDDQVITGDQQFFAAASSLPASSNDGGQNTIDILVVYTAAARTAVGGTDAMAAFIQGSVDSTNTAFSESDMNARFQLVHAEEITGATETDTGDALDWVTADTDVAALRDLYGADMVTILVDTPSSCGTAWVQRTPASWFASYAFAATDVDCALGGLTFAHEHGHNMGLEHNPGNSSVGDTPEEAAYPWSFGFYVDGSYRTIMSYGSACTSYCARSARFSNPDIVYNDVATGVANSQDNARTGDLTAPIIKDFRANVVNVAPEPIVDVRISQPSDDAEESVNSGAVDIDSSDLEFGYDGAVSSNQYLGLRFMNLNIPNGASVTSAYLEFTVDESNGAATSADIRIETADNPVSFTEVVNNVSGRDTSTTAVNWNIPAWDTVGITHQSPDLAALVQEVVDRPGWSAGNAMAFVVTATGDRTAESWDGEPTMAPLLHIEYESIQSVTIDVLPGNGANEVFPNMSGNLPVAVLSSEDFDATQIDPNTLKFGASEAVPSESVEYVDLDSLHTLDAQTRFSVPETGIACNDTEVTLIGETLGGDSFTGTDTIDATQCQEGGCHAYQ